jgi:hypothetical protein
MFGPSVALVFGLLSVIVSAGILLGDCRVELGFVFVCRVFVCIYYATPIRLRARRIACGALCYLLDLYRGSDYNAAS